MTDADDLDLRELLERLESNREEVVDRVGSSDKLAQDLTRQVLKALKDETEELKHLIAQTALENSGDDESKQRMKLFKLLEAELTARNKYDKRAAGVEEAGIKGLKDLLEGYDSEQASELSVGEISEQDLRNPGTCRSKTITKIGSGVASSARTIRKLISMFDGERKRRIKGITIWNAAVQNGTVDLGTELTQHLENLRTLDERADKLSRDLVLTLRSFADGADSFGTALGQTVRDNAVHLGEAKAKQSGAEMARAKREAAGAMSQLLAELDGALEKLSMHAQSVNGQLKESRTSVHGEREIILDMLHALRLAAHAGEHGLDEDHDHDHLDDGGEGGIAGRHDREQKALDAEHKKQEDDKVKKLEGQLKANADRQKALADSNTEAQQEIAKATLAEHDLTEATAAKIMKQYEDDAQVVGDMLANERRRQAEIMRNRLAEQRFRRKKNLAKTHADEAEEQKVLKQQQEAQKELHDKQEAEYHKVVAELVEQEKAVDAQWAREDAEEEVMLASLVTAEDVANFETRIKAQLENPETANDPDNVRRLQHLLSKLEFKKILVAKHAEAKVLLAEAKARNDEAEVARITQTFTENVEALAKSADAEKKRQKAALKDRLQRKRERRMRDLQHKHEQELNELNDEHNEQASELQSRLEEHDNLARIIHEVKAEAGAEEDAVASAEKEALVDEQARMREELRRKQEEEQSAVADEEREDSVIDSINDPFLLTLTQLKIENDLQKEAGAVNDAQHDSRVENYSRIEVSIGQLTKKRDDLSTKRADFANRQSGTGATDDARRDADVARLKEMESRVDMLEAQVSSQLDAAEEDMKAGRERIRKMQGGLSPRDSAKDALDRQADKAAVLSAQVLKLREEGGKSGLSVCYSLCGVNAD